MHARQRVLRHSGAARAAGDPGRPRLPAGPGDDSQDHRVLPASHLARFHAQCSGALLARAHRDQSLEYFTLLLESDVADVQGGTTAEGIHLAAMAGSVDLLQRCFTGLETRGGVLRFNAQWPEKLGTFTCRLRFRGHDIIVRISSTLLRVTAAAGDTPEIQVGCHDQWLPLLPAKSIEFPSPPPDALCSLQAALLSSNRFLSQFAVQERPRVSKPA